MHLNIIIGFSDMTEKPISHYDNRKCIQSFEAIVFPVNIFYVLCLNRLF